MKADFSGGGEPSGSGEFVQQEAEGAVSSLSAAARPYATKNARQERPEQQHKKGPIVENAAPDLGDVKSKAAAASESGWTAYFGQATNDYCLSEVSFQCRAANARTGKLLLRQDSSVLSDASSPLDGLGENFSEPAMQDAGNRCKRRRKESDESLAAVVAAAENAEDGSLVDDEACSSDCGSTMWVTELARADANAIDVRLKVLQRLVPNGDKYDSAETLDRTVEYVRCLEHKIKLLERRIVRKHSKIDVVELQDLGLCLVPLNAATEVLKAGARFVSGR